MRPDCGLVRKDVFLYILEQLIGEDKLIQCLVIGAINLFHVTDPFTVSLVYKNDILDRKSVV